MSTSTEKISSIRMLSAWLGITFLVLLIVLLLRLALEQPVDNTVMALPTVTPSTEPMTSSPEATALPVIVDPVVADGVVDPVPAVSHLPVASGELRNQERVHAGDDSMFLKDEDSASTKEETADDAGGA